MTITQSNGNVKKYFDYYGGQMRGQDKPDVQKEFDTISELCQRTGKCYRTIHRAIRAGKIKSVRLGGSVMVPRREVQRVLEKGF